MKKLTYSKFIITICAGCLILVVIFKYLKSLFFNFYSIYIPNKVPLPPILRFSSPPPTSIHSPERVRTAMGSQQSLPHQDEAGSIFTIPASRLGKASHYREWVTKKPAHVSGIYSCPTVRGPTNSPSHTTVTQMQEA